MSWNLVFRRISAGVPLHFRRWWAKVCFEKLVPSGIPLDFRHASAGLPPQAVRKMKPTTYPSDRYDSTHRHLTHPILLHPSSHVYLSLLLLVSIFSGVFL
jgi:hypothetical protein